MARRKRGHGEGTIYYRESDGYWCSQITIGTDPKTGKPKRKTFYGRTRKEVAEKLTKAKQTLSDGLYIEPSKATLGQWLDKWLTEYKKPQLKPSTYQSYEFWINAHIKPDLGEAPLEKLQPHILQKFYNDKLKSGRRDGEGGLSTRVVRYFHAIIRQALEQAVKEGILPRNVADATNPPTIQHKPMRPLAEEELLKFFEAAKDDRYFAGYVLAATAGMRRGELCGLCWDCVDLEQGTVTVRRQLLVLKDGLSLEDTTKSKRGRRSIALTNDAIRELKAHRRRQAQERLLMGQAYQDNNLVFAREDGTPTDPRNFTKRFQRILKRAGLPKVRLHDLRHTHASLLLSRGVHPKIVQERLGHSSISMTLDLYSHLAPGLDEAAAATLNGLIKERPSAKAKDE